MSYCDILVHVDNSEACRARIATAIALAVRCGARLHGCCVVRPENLAFYGEGAIAGDIIQAALQREDEDLASAESRFREAVKGAGLVTECTAVKGDPGQVLSQSAGNVDLTVVGQPDGDDPRCTSTGVAASVAFGAAAGVLVHPFRGEFPSVGKRVLIAWDGSREAQRAVFEALPLLRDAEHVEVISVLTEALPGDAGDEPAREICARLGRRGIEAHAHYVSAADEAAGETLLTRCTDQRADLLVLGAYGHSRLREFLLGGVTRTVLRDHKIPVLLAH